MSFIFPGTLSLKSITHLQNPKLKNYSNSLPLNTQLSGNLHCNSLKTAYKMDSQTLKTDGIVRRGPSFSLIEDEMVCKAWLAIKEELSDGLNQGKGSFWNRALELFNEYTGAPNSRTAKALSGRWLTIQENLNIFCGLLAELKIINRSDDSFHSQIAEAKRQFCVSQKSAFKWDVCWEMLKDSPHWKKYQATKCNDTEANKKRKPTFEVDPFALEGESSTPTTPRSHPPAPDILPSSTKPTSMDKLLKERPFLMKDEKENEKKSDDQIIHLSKIVEESNTLLKSFISSVDERLGRCEDFALRNLQLKEEKFRQRQLEMREQQFERDRQIMDMKLDHMLPMQRQFYEMKQREICDGWKIKEPTVGGGGSSALEIEGGEIQCNGGSAET